MLRYLAVLVAVSAEANLVKDLPSYRLPYYPTAMQLLNYTRVSLRSMAIMWCLVSVLAIPDLNMQELWTAITLTPLTVFVPHLGMQTRLNPVHGQGMF